MVPLIRPALLLAACLSLAALPVAASPVAASADRVERLVDAVTQMVPLGAIFDGLAAGDARWPLADRAEGAGGDKLACVRGELSSAGYRRYQRPLVQAYASENAGRLEADLALLEGGAAALFGKLALAGAESKRTGVEPNPDLLLADATPAQLTAFMGLISAPANAGLRQLGGFGEALSAGKSEAENEAAGERVGYDLGVRLLRLAFTTCDLDPALLP